MEQYIFGVDVGGTTVKIGLFSGQGDLLDKWEIPTRTQEKGKWILPDIAASIEGKMEQLSAAWEQVLGIGIGVPGPIGADGTVYECVNLGWGRVELKQELRRLLPGAPTIAAGNDANVAALGELWQGGGRGYDSAVMITLGTGVGGGVVLNGRIVAGVHGGAGEVGHITVEPGETVVCNCGKCGCLEQYASANGIVRLASRMLAQSNKPSALRTMERFTSKDICDLAREGEEMAGDILDRCGEYLGRVMSYVGCTLDPDVFILGGGMSRAGRVIIDVVKKHYRKYAFNACADTDVVTAKLGNDAGIYGCAKMILG